jgi:hypothetical protein
MADTVRVLSQFSPKSNVCLQSAVFVSGSVIFISDSRVGLAEQVTTRRFLCDESSYLT